jgi:putative membrane protein
MRIFVWLVVFVALFAFSLKNLESATVKWFFGQEWHAPMVVIVLAAFGLGCAFGIFAMVPSWWRHRRIARREAARAPAAATALPGITTRSGEPALVHPPRDGL